MSTTYIPQSVRRDLWIKSGARCEFRGCNKAIDRNFITDQKVSLGAYCHIVGDSPGGPRGDPERSIKLAADPENLMLCCPSCHKTIDESKLQGEYPEALLIEMKYEHELHIQRIYDARNVKLSIPLIITSRIGGTPTSVNQRHARYAVLQKTGYRRFPAYTPILVSLNEVGVDESESIYWALAKQALDRQFDIFRSSFADGEIEHVDVFGLAQIPILMYAGYLLGDRVPATAHQAQRDQDNKWLWPRDTQHEVTYEVIKPELRADVVTELSLIVRISGYIRNEDVIEVVPGAPIMTIETAIKSPSIIRQEKDILNFSLVWREVMAYIHSHYGCVRLNIFPAVPNSIAFEMGRSVHPKVMPCVCVWDFSRGAFSRAIEYGID